MKPIINLNFSRPMVRTKIYFAITFSLLLFFQLGLQAQVIQKDSTNNITNAGWVSLGGRSTVSTFSDEGFGYGTGGQFRIQLGNRVNTDWFADYIVTNPDQLRSEYIHIGWSVLFYPIEKLSYPNYRLQPFILAGHCFDYNRKSLLSTSNITKDRFGSAVQAGIGTHIHLTKRMDITFMTQYMIHLTNELELENNSGVYYIEENKANILQGHSLTTIGLNYKIFKLWKK